MAEENYDKPARSSAMTPIELETAQWRIDVCSPGLKKIDEIYGDCWPTESGNKQFGKVFKAAVLDGMLQGISLHVIDGREVLSPDRQLLYVIHAKADSNT